MDIFKIYELCNKGRQNDPEVQTAIRDRNQRILNEIRAREADEAALEQARLQQELDVMERVVKTKALVQVENLGDIHPLPGWSLYKAGNVYAWKGHGRIVVSYGGIMPPDRL